jgi:phenylacetate-coenzyme A ligase PaaK-like adenylate-forming protein
MAITKKVLVAKTYGAQLYKWSPDAVVVKNSKGTTGARPYYCSATPNSQGQDWITTFAYNVVILNGEKQKIAYVACDYVE